MPNKNETNDFDEATIVNGITIINGATVTDREMVIRSGFVANRISVSSGGRLVVAPGGIANETTLSSEGHLIVYRDGTINRTFVGPDGNVILRYGARAFETTVASNGSFDILRDGGANNIIVQSGGILHVSCTGIATGINASEGARLHFGFSKRSRIQGASNGNSFDIKNGCVSDYTVDHGNGLTITDKCKADKITVKPYADIYVESGGRATNLVIEENGIISFDLASNTYLEGTSAGSAFEIKEPILASCTLDHGMIHIFDGGIANEIHVNGPEKETPEDRQGFLIIDYDAIVNKVVISGGMVSMEGGVVNKIDLNNGKLVVFHGAVDSVHIEKGYADVFEGGKINCLDNYGEMTICSGGVIVSNSVSGSGLLVIKDGAEVYHTDVSYGGKVVVSSGGTALFIRNHDGDLEIHDGAFVLNVEDK